MNQSKNANAAWFASYRFGPYNSGWFGFGYIMTPDFGWEPTFPSFLGVQRWIDNRVDDLKIPRKNRQQVQPAYDALINYITGSFLNQGFPVSFWEVLVVQCISVCCWFQKMPIV